MDSTKPMPSVELSVGWYVYIGKKKNFTCRIFLSVHNLYATGLLTVETTLTPYSLC